MIQLETPRNTCGWGLGLTDTFRNNSGKLFGRFGTNLQNPTKNICSIYYADRDKCLVQIDQSGAEALIVSMLCRADGNYRKLFANKIKPHSYVAIHLFKYSWLKEGHDITPAVCKADINGLRKLPGFNELYDTVKNNYKRYFLGKKTVHAATYAMGTGVFISSALKESEGKIVLTPKEGDMFLELFHSILPEIQEDFQQEVSFMLKRDGLLRNLFGHPRRIYGPLIDYNIKAFYAFIPQSTVGCITNIAMVDFYNYIRKEGRDWDILNNKHDSFLYQCPANEVDESISVAQNMMNMNLVTYKGETFKMQSEVQVGLNWGEYDKEHNNDGLKKYEPNTRVITSNQ